MTLNAIEWAQSLQLAFQPRVAQSQEILGFRERLENQTEFQRADSTDAKVFLQIAQFPTKDHDHQYRHVNIDITHKTLTKEAKKATTDQP